MNRAARRAGEAKKRAAKKWDRSPMHRQRQEATALQQVVMALVRREGRIRLDTSEIDSLPDGAQLLMEHDESAGTLLVTYRDAPEASA